MTDVGRLLLTILLFIVVLGPIVLIHEVGHFLAAKLANVRILEFGIGIPPRARVLRSSGETQWTLNWLPIGGFVKMDGEDGDTGDARSFAAKPLWVRLAILVAGVAMNVVLAAVIFIGIAWLPTQAYGIRIPVGGVQADSPAAQAGLVPGDVILAIDGQYYDAYGGGLISGIRQHAGQTVSLAVGHADGTVANVSVTLRSAAEIDAGHGTLGISATQDHPFVPVATDRSAGWPLADATGIGLGELGRWSGLIVGGLGDLAHSVATNPTAAPPVSGPIGIATQLYDVFVQNGWVYTLYIAGILSINLAVVNILPFPPLDGGRMLVLVIKRLVGRRLSLRAEQLTYVVGFMFLLGFILWVSGFDIARQLAGGQ